MEARPSFRSFDPRLCRDFMFVRSSINPGPVPSPPSPSLACTRSRRACPAKVFEIVSIKLSKPGTSGSGTENLPNGFRDRNIALDILVEDAYYIINGEQIVRINQVAGMPSWAKSEGRTLLALKVGNRNSRCCKPYWPIGASSRCISIQRNCRYTIWWSPKVV